MNQVFVQLAEGFEEIEAVTIIDVLRRAEMEVITVSITGNSLVKGAHNIVIKVDTLFENVNFNDGIMIILPGGMPGAQNLNEHYGLKSQILEYEKSGKFLGAICAAPMVFGNLSIFKGRKAVCYPGFEKYINDAELQMVPFVSDERIITGRGVGAALKFSLEIVKIMKGEEIAEKLRHAMLVE